MKQVLRLTTIVALMMLGVASQAHAVTSLQLIACQGTICASTPVTVGSIITIAAPVVVGDFTVNAQGSSSEGAFLSNAQETSISVERTGITSGTALDVWLVATNYNLPNPPGTIDSTHTATFNDDPTSVNAASSVTFQGWISMSNFSLTGVGGPGAFVGPVGLPGGLQTNGLVACTPDAGGSCAANGNAAALAGGATPFSLITRTTFNIPVSGQFDIYTSGSQVFVTRGTAVPEPASMMLLGTGLLGLARAARRRRAQ